jgi:hypothetical protein
VSYFAGTQARRHGIARENTYHQEDTTNNRHKRYMRYMTIDWQKSVPSTTHILSAYTGLYMMVEIPHIAFPPAVQETNFSIVQLIIPKHLLKLDYDRLFLGWLVSKSRFSSRHLNKSTVSSKVYAQRHSCTRPPTVENHERWRFRMECLLYKLPLPHACGGRLWSELTLLGEGMSQFRSQGCRVSSGGDRYRCVPEAGEKILRSVREWWLAIQMTYATCGAQGLSRGR